MSEGAPGIPFSSQIKEQIQIKRRRMVGLEGFEPRPRFRKPLTYLGE